MGGTEEKGLASEREMAHDALHSCGEAKVEDAISLIQDEHLGEPRRGRNEQEKGHDHIEVEVEGGDDEVRKYVRCVYCVVIMNI